MTQPNGKQGLSARLQEAARQRTVLDVGAQRVGKVYAESLLRAAEKHNQAPEVLEELESLVHDLFRRDPLIEAFLASTAIGHDRKEAALRLAFTGRASDVFLDFLLVLNKHDRLDLLRAIAAAYRDLFDQRAGRIRVHVQSAVALPDDQQDRLRQEIRSVFQKEPVLEARVNPDLIGGIVVRVGDWTYDTSVRTQLQRIRDQLIERSSYEIQSRRDRFSSPDGN
jgi:F-type H+-transporting ATPase subunit delta